MFENFVRRAFPAMILLLAPVLIVTAQEAEITGRATDSTDALVPGVKIGVRNVDTGAVRSTISNDAGLFDVPTLQPGSYSITAEKEGFKTITRSGVRLEVGQVARVNFRLEVGSVREAVEVAASQSELHLETDSNSLGTVIDSARVDELPLNGRNFLQLALLAAGSGEATGRSKHSQIARDDRFISVGGNKTSATAYLINGIQQRGTRLGELALSVSVANIEEFKVQQSFFMLDQGPNAGVVSITTKGGTNRYHGQAFYFLRNQALDARNFFSPEAESLKRNQFGGTLGGPIRRDKAWFSTTYEGLRDTSEFSRGVYTPTQAMFDGDFSGVTATIYDPQSFSAQTGTRSPFAGNRIPTDRINAVSNRLLTYYLPGASLSQTPSNLFRNPHNTDDTDQWSVRADAALTSKQTVFGEFIHDNSPSVRSGVFRLSGTLFPTESEAFTFQHTYTMTPSTVETVRFGLSRNQALQANEANPLGGLAAEIGFANTLSTRGVPGVGLQGYAGFGNARGDLGNIDNNYQLDYGLNYSSGKHQIKFGAGVRYRRTWQQNSNAGAVGTVSFQSVFTARLAPDATGTPVAQANSGNSFADFLLGFPVNAAVQGLPEIPYRHWQLMPYWQDSWKIGRGFTLNYGFGWFLDTVPDPQGDKRSLVHGIDTTTGLMRFASLGEITTKVLAVDKNNFTPRLGFAWQPQFLPRAVIRAGVGSYYSDLSFIDLQYSLDGPPYNATIRGDNDPRRPVPVYQLGLNLFPPRSFAPVDPNYARNLPQGTATKILWENGRLPYVNQWNFSLQYSVSNNDLLTLDYQGSSAHKQQTRRQLAQCVPGPDLFCNNANRPYLRYSDIQTVDHVGNISYEALSARYNHRYNAGLDLRFEYNFSKGLSDSYEITGFDHQITTCRRCDKGYISFDQRHRAVVSALWDVPYGHHRRYGATSPWIANNVLGGWTLTTITTFATGFPIPMSSPNVTGTPTVAHLPNRVCDGANSSLADNVRNNGFLYFDTGCFVRPPSGYFGTSGRDPLHGPGRQNWDIGIQKFFSFTESIRLQFRAEMFNAFNHTQFGLPNGNAGDSVNFGRISSADLPRLVQFGLKLLW